jgi:uncharacterized protein DUF2846
MRAAMSAAFFLICIAALDAQDQTGTIVFYREPHFATGDFKPTIFCDNTEFARIENGTYFQITAPAGAHNCSVETLHGHVIEVNVLAGRTTYVHVELVPGIRDHAALVNTTEVEYNKEKARLKPVKEWSRDTLRDAQPPESTDTAERSNTNKQVNSKTKDRHSGKFGDLAVSVTKLANIPVQYQKDRTELAAFVSVANTGKGVICAEFNVTLNTTFDLQYRGVWGQAPRMHEMLPGETAEGRYVFDIKDGGGTA